MKKLFLIIISVLLMQSCVSLKQLNPTPKTKIVNVIGKTKNEIYIRANTWMVETFNNAKSVIQFSDKESGIVTGRYLMKTITVTTTEFNNVFSMIKIQVKDGAAKITVTPQSYVNNPNIIVGGKGYPLEKMNADIDILINNFSKSIIKTESTDW